METNNEDQVIPEERKEKTRPARACEQCGNEHTLGTKAKFCSVKCKNAYHRAHRGLGNSNDQLDTEEKNTDPEEQEAAVSVLSKREKLVINGVNPQVQYIIMHQQREMDKLQAMYNEERAARKKVKSKYEDLKAELIKLKHDHELYNLENQKPSTLEGLADSPLMGMIMPHLAPALGHIAMSVAQRATGGASAAMGLQGVEGQLDAEAQTQLMEINNWYSKLSPKLQATVYDIITKLSSEGEKLGDILQRIQNILSHGRTTVINHQGTNMSTGTY